MIYNRKVDFHSHFLSATYYEYLKKYEDSRPDGFPTPVWTPEGHLELMEKLGIAFALLSVSSPNLSKADKETEISMVHQINLEGAELVRQHPDRFGLFASLPLPHTAEAIEEARFDLDNLHACGFGLSTNYAGVYLGDPRYDDLMQFLNDRAAVIAVHPVKPAGLPENVNRELPVPAMEFFMDTTRTFTNMVMNDIFGRYPAIRWIFPHAGAFISVLSDRLTPFPIQFRGNMAKDRPVDFKADMRHVYFDTAGFPCNKQLHDLLQDLTSENLLYGSDAPYTPPVTNIAQAGSLENYLELTPDEKENMFTLNAVRLLPQLETILSLKADGKTVCYADCPLTLKEKQSRSVRKVISKIYHRIFK